jgi:putative ABC transport system permease protein
MAPLADFTAGLAAWLVPGDLRHDWEREWAAELAACRSRGWSERRLAVRALGAWVHAAWLRADRWRWDVIWQDLKYAARLLQKRPGFTLVAVLSLAVGIGANAAIFGAVRAVLLRPLPFPEPHRLVALATTTLETPDARRGTSSPPDFVDWRRDVDAFESLAAISADAAALTGDGPAEQVPSASVTGDFFEVLGVAPLQGRTIRPEDDPVGTPDVVVLSHGLWRRRWGGRADLIGTTIMVDGKPTIVAGVMPEGFAYPLDSQLWLPLRFTAKELETQRGALYLDVIGRLRSGVAFETAAAALRQYAAHLAELYPRYNYQRTVALNPMRDALVGDVKPALLIMLAAVGFVLLIVCVNVANLALTGALGRQRELAVRTALGAGRGRLARGLLVESALLAAIGGASGLLVALWGTRMIAALDAGVDIPMLDQTRVDLPVTAFTVVASALSAVLFGTLPAWHAAKRLDIMRAIKDDGGTTTGDRGRQRLRGGLIVLEAALSVVLLIGAGLLMRSFLGLTVVDLGFDPSRIQTFNLSLPATSYPTQVSRATRVDGVISEIAARPDVEAAAAIFGLPLSDFNYTISTSTIDGRTLDRDDQDRRSMQVRVVTADYFRVMGIPMLEGRTFQPADGSGAPPVIAVNRAAAAVLWPDTAPLGRSMTLGTRLGQGGVPAGGTVVGLVENVHDRGPGAAPRPTVYLAHAQFPVEFITVVVKARGEPTQLIEPLRRLVAVQDPSLPLFRVRTMEQLARDAVAQPRVFLLLLGIFAVASVLLAAIGIYGVMAHAVSQRTREIGLRMALGADRTQVLRMVIGQALTLATLGLALGLALGAGAGRLMRGLLFGVEPFDPMTFAVAGAGFVLVALAASATPAIRAARVDPADALRSL